MTDKDKVIADIIASAIRSGFKITFERNDIGAEKNGTHFHVAYVDELVEEMGNINPWDYINEKIREDWKNNAETKNT